MKNIVRTQVLVVGSEGAGSRAALEANWNGAEVLMVSKGLFGGSGATIMAGADIDIDSKSVKTLLGLPGDESDSPSIFFDDIMASGRYINDDKLVSVHVDDAPQRLKELVDWGMKVTGLIHAAGHSYPRSVYTSGKEIMRTLKKQVDSSSIKVKEHTMAIDLLKRGDSVVGVLALDLVKGEYQIIEAQATILATGGGMMTFPFQTAAQELTGDGQAMAWRAGAQLIDMEMVQFLPCVFIDPPMWRGLAFPFMLGPMGGLEGWLLNKHGNRYMKKWDSDHMEKSTRDVLSRALSNEVLEGRGSPNGGAWLSFAHLPSNLIEYLATWHAKPYLKSDWRYKGFDFSEFMSEVKSGAAIEVGCASHFFMGGIKIDIDCRTNIPGLYAAGEVAGGLHGANRLQGNACTQIIVQGARAGKAAARYAKESDKLEVDHGQISEFIDRYEDLLSRKGDVKPVEIKSYLQKLAGETIGVVRERKGLEKGLQLIQAAKRDTLPRLNLSTKERQYNREWVEAIQLNNIILVMEAIGKSALAREESRGAHYRKDFPKENEQWKINMLIENKEQDAVLKKISALNGTYRQGVER